MRRTKAEAEKTRQLILSTALQCFDQKGYEQTTLNHIAKAANLTRGAIYWHFENKADLFRVIAENYLSGIINEMQSSLSGEHTWKNISEFFQDFFRQFHEKPDRAQFFRLMEQRGETYTPLLQDLDAKYGAMWHQVCERAIILGIKEGDIDPQIDIEWAHMWIRTMMIGLSFVHLHYPNKPNLMKHSDRIIDNHIALLRRPLI